MTRHEANVELLVILTELVEKYPDLRFGQILSSFEFVDTLMVDNQYGLTDVGDWKNEFYVEPTVILERVKGTLGGN